MSGPKPKAPSIRDKIILKFLVFQVSVRSASSGAASNLPLGGNGSPGGSSATMKKLGLALYFMSTMAVMVMNM